MGLVGIKPIAYSMQYFDYVSYTYKHAGIKSLLTNDRVSQQFMQLTTIIFDPVNRVYVTCSFFILVMEGIMCTVWYKYMPGVPLRSHEELYPIPVAVVPDTIGIDFLNHPSPIMNGYNKAQFLITKDITESVIHWFETNPQFRELWKPEYCNNLITNGLRCTYAGFGTAIMLAVFLTTKIIIPPGIA